MKVTQGAGGESLPGDVGVCGVKDLARARDKKQRPSDFSEISTPLTPSNSARTGEGVSEAKAKRRRPSKSNI